MQYFPSNIFVMNFRSAEIDVYWGIFNPISLVFPKTSPWMQPDSKKYEINSEDIKDSKSQGIVKK